MEKIGKYKTRLEKEQNPEYWVKKIENESVEEMMKLIKN